MTLKRFSMLMARSFLSLVAAKLPKPLGKCPAARMVIIRLWQTEGVWQ